MTNKSLEWLLDGNSNKNSSKVVDFRSKIFLRDSSLKKTTYMMVPNRELLEEEYLILKTYIQLKEIDNKIGVYLPMDENPFMEEKNISKIIEYNKNMLQDSEDVSLLISTNTYTQYFDEGMLFQSRKPWNIINFLEYNLSFELVELFTYFADNAIIRRKNKLHHFKQVLEDKRYLIEEINEPTTIFWEPEPEKFFEIGMLYYAEKPFLIANIDKLELHSENYFESFLIEQHSKAINYLIK